MQISTEFSSSNYSSRLGSIKYIILHYTELSFDVALNSYLDSKIELSPHYLIHEDGKIFNLVPDKYAAWHAGKSFWHGLEKLNEHSIGIEIDNFGNSEFSAPQLNSCIELCHHLIKLHNIAPHNILGHSDIACDRKIDPGIFFDWQYLAEYGLGLWPKPYNQLKFDDKIIFKFGDSGPEILTFQQKLSAIGYKIDLTSAFDLQTNYVVRAFQSHFYYKLIHIKGLDFYRDNSSKYEWNSSSEAILNNLLVKYSF